MPSLGRLAALALALLPAQCCAAKVTFRMGFCYAYQDGMYVNMAKIALDAGFFDDILPCNANSANFTIALEGVNDQCDGSISTVAALPWLLGVGVQNGRIHSDSTSTPPVAGIIGCECSGATMPVASIGNNFKMPMVSGSATGPDLSDKGLYPYFARVIPPDSMQGGSFAAIVMYFKWKRVLAAYPGEPYAQGVASSFKARLATSSGVNVIDYQFPFQALDSPSMAATFDHEAWEKIVAQVALESPQPRVFFSSGNQLDHLLRIFRDAGLVSTRTAWMLSDSVCSMQQLVWIGADAATSASYQAADPTDPWWNYTWADTAKNMKGSFCVTPKAFGPKYFAPRFQNFFRSVTRTQLEAAAWDTSTEGWDDAWLTNDWFEDQSYNPMQFESVTPFVYAIAQMMSRGVPVADIQGDALRDEIFAAKFEGITGTVGFDERGDRLAPYNIWNFKIANKSAYLDVVGWYDGIANNITWSSKPIFADGTTNVPLDQPVPCNPGTEFHDAFVGCVNCSAGKASLSTNSRCVNCTLGFFQDAPGQSACEPAPRGSIVAVPGAVAPASCAPGTYSGDRGLTECSTCGAGTFAETGSMSACQQAPPGTFVSTVGATANSRCAPGRFSAVDAAQECTDCLAGFFQGEPGASGCSRCERGSFAPPASASCRSCAEGMTTESAASALATDCQCGLGQYCHGPYPDCECRDCPEGMTCPWGAKEQDLLPFNAQGAPLLVKPHYYTKADDPLSVYFCHPSLGDARCAGGPPESCGDMFQDLTCATCPEGYAPKGSKCEPCSGGNVFVLAIMPIIGVACCVCTYYFGNRQVESNTSITLGVSVVAGLLVTLAQLFATFSQLTMPWPVDIGNFFQGTRFLVINPNVISAYCVGASVLRQYSIRFIMPYCVVIAVAMCFLVARLLQMLGVIRRPGFFWQLPKAVNSVFQIYQGIFIALTAIAVVPYQCYSHPNGRSGLVQFPTVLCGTEEHGALVAMSVVLLLTFVLPFLGVLIWANIHAMTIRADFARSQRHLMMFRFLMYRFRPDVWWWGTPFTIRQLMLAFAPMVQPDDPHAQCIFVIAVLLLYVPCVCFFWPWKSDELNLLDATSMGFVALLVAAGSSFMPASQFNSGHLILMKVVLIILGVIGAALVMYGAYVICRKGTLDLGGMFAMNEHRLKRKSVIVNLISDLYALTDTIRAAPIQDLIEALLLMNSYDLSAVHRVIAVFQASTIPLVGGSGSLPRRLLAVPSSCAAGSQREETRSRSGDLAHEVLGADGRKLSGKLPGPTFNQNQVTLVTV